MHRLLWCGTLLLILAACAAPAPAPQPAAFALDPPFTEAALEPSSGAAGDALSLYLAMDVPSDQSTVLTLSIAYPDGDTQDVVKSIFGNQTTLTWTIPRDAGSGLATFSVSMLGCGCGPFLSGASSDRVSSGVLTGEFVVD